MRLLSLRYSEYDDTDKAWTLEGLLLNDKNLVVGKNSSGKSRILNVISSLADHLGGLRTPSLSGTYEVVFVDGEKTLEYYCKFDDSKVIKETFSIDGKILLNRGLGGIGTIWAEEINEGSLIKFQTPQSELATVSRRDNIQHKFLESLYVWGSSVRVYRFGTSLGKDSVAVFEDKSKNLVNDRDTNAVIALYKKAFDEFGQDFNNQVIKDMAALNYSIEDLGLTTPVSVIFTTNQLGKILCLYVKEKDLLGITDQHSMSQGMFRALSILIQVNYSQMSNKANCIIIDDIGEGLDFERSCELIDLLRNKADESNIQLILSTNDRFVMNKVPLEEWSFIHRIGSHVKVKNITNSKKVFEEFKFTGLSNFSFLELDFINENLDEQEI